MSSYLEMRKVTKYFSENVVLDEVNFFADKGKVNALIGENGAGKTTLMKILAGIHKPDSGDLYIDGNRVVINSTKQAQNLGIHMIYQEIRLFSDLSIMENVFIRKEPLKNKGFIKLIDWKKAADETRIYLERFGLELDPRRLVNTLSIGQQKLVEIIRCLSQSANIIIMDEPTLALTDKEVDLLFSLIEDSKKLGITIIYISHRLGEVKRIADNITVIRDGKLIETTIVNNRELDSLITAMAGKEEKDRYPKLKVKKGKVQLSVKGLSYGERLKNISFEVSKGEIIAITGLSGSGRRTLAKVLCGLEGPFTGQIVINGKIFDSMTANQAKQNGLCYVPGLGSDESLISNMKVNENITLTNLERVSKSGFLNFREESTVAKDLLKRLEIDAIGNEYVENLSGGKQKKVTLAKWLFTNSKIFILDEPTAGIDISSKVDIYNILNELLLSGATIIMISSDLSEVLGMCDKVIVMFNGEMKGIFDKADLNQEKILYYASGGF